MRVRERPYLSLCSRLRRHAAIYTHISSCSSFMACSRVVWFQSLSDKTLELSYMSSSLSGFNADTLLLVITAFRMPTAAACLRMFIVPSTAPWDTHTSILLLLLILDTETYVDHPSWICLSRHGSRDVDNCTHTFQKQMKKRSVLCSTLCTDAMERTSQSI